MFFINMLIVVFKTLSLYTLSLLKILIDIFLVKGVVFVIKFLLWNVRFYVVGVNYLVGLGRVFLIIYSHLSRYIDFEVVGGYVRSILWILVYDMIRYSLVMPLIVFIITGDFPYFGPTNMISIYVPPDPVPGVIEEIDGLDYLETRKSYDVEAKINKVRDSSTTYEYEIRKSNVSDLIDHKVDVLVDEGQAGASYDADAEFLADVADYTLYFICTAYIIGVLIVYLNPPGSGDP